MGYRCCFQSEHFQMPRKRIQSNHRCLCMLVGLNLMMEPYAWSAEDSQNLAEPNSSVSTFSETFALPTPGDPSLAPVSNVVTTTETPTIMWEAEAHSSPIDTTGVSSQESGAPYSNTTALSESGCEAPLFEEFSGFDPGACHQMYSAPSKSLLFELPLHLIQKPLTDGVMILK